MFVFTGMLFLSVFWSPDVVRSLNNYAASMGVVLLLALTIPDAFRTEEKLRYLLYVLVFSGVYVDAVQILNHYRDFENGIFLTTNTINHYRSFSDSLIFYLPFMMALATLSKRGWAVACWILVFLQLVLLGLTASRGAWAGAVAGLGVWIALTLQKRVIIAALSAIAVVAVVSTMIPENIVSAWAARGLWSAGRWEVAWTPACGAILANPFFGYGYGLWVYEDLVRPTLTANGGIMGPHSNYLEIGLAAGVFALAALIAFYARFIERIVTYVRKRPLSLSTCMALAALTAFVAEYLVRGFVESVTWRHLGILVGCGVAVLLQRQAART